MDTLDQIRLGEVAPRQRMSWIEISIFVVLLLVISAVGATFNQNAHIEQRQRAIKSEQDAGKVRGYLNRAVTCDLQKGLGLPESKGCNDPAIEQYRDVSTKPGSTQGARNSLATMRVVCEIADGLKIRAPDCED